MSNTTIKNMYVTNLDSIIRDDIYCLSAKTDDADLWH